jgi:hypothetical protein
MEVFYIFLLQNSPLLLLKLQKYDISYQHSNSLSNSTYTILFPVVLTRPCGLAN